jgi:hypothetical protein
MLVISHSYAWLYQLLISLNKIIIITTKVSSRISAHYWFEMCFTCSCKKLSVFITLIKIRTYFWIIFFIKYVKYNVNSETNCKKWIERYVRETGCISAVLVSRPTKSKHRERHVILKLTQRNWGIFRSLKVRSASNYKIFYFSINHYLWLPRILYRFFKTKILKFVPSHTCLNIQWSNVLPTKFIAL